jgi:hemerythrin superfamily protein
MVSLTDEKRAALAEKLAGMKAIQNLIISNEQEFINQCDDAEIRDRLQKMLSDDQKNLGIIETAITQYGIQSEPKDKIQQMVQKAEDMMSGSDLTMYEKMAQHELLKHGQVMSGLIVHKAAQIVGADVQAALAPINTVNFENRAHQEQLKGVLELLGTRELTGQEADQGLWSRVQDAVAAISGVVGSVATQSSDQSDLKIQDIIRMDHQKVNVLIGEIEQSNDVQKVQEYFGQLYQDLLVHSVAEEQVVYPGVRPFYGDEDTQELYDEQAQLKEILNQMKSLEPNSQEFKDMLQQVKAMVGDHTRQEESTMFSAINSNCSSEQQQQMATEFKEAKKQLQMEMAG